MNPQSCFHCGLPATGSAACEGEINGVSQSFCCSGCLSVCQVIHDAGLDDFYKRLEKRESHIAPPPDTPTDIDQYDLPEIQSEFVQQLANGSQQAQLMVEGIHCPSCVWLIEKALSNMDGVIQAEVNLVHHRLLLTWQPDKLPLTQIMLRLSALGYAAVPFNADAVEGNVRQQNRRILFRLGFAGFGAMNIMWISIALYAGSFSGISTEYQHFFHWVSCAIATPVLLYSGGPMIHSAWLGLLQKKLNMDLPIAIGALTTYSYSLWQTLQGNEHVYFDTVVTFLFVILIGRYLEALARRNASSATLRLLELQPRMATRLTQDDVEERVSVRKLVAGDRLRIRPGDKVPADGVVLEGNSHLDESMLTGEFKLIHKHVGSALSAGTVNHESSLCMQVEKTGSATMLSRIIHLVESAQGSKAPIQRLADRIVPYFVASTLTLAAITFIYWSLSDINTALLAATAVLIITCPCALGLATPMAIAVSAGLAAKKGVLIRNGEALERLSSINHVVMDKTGTLTEGRMRISNIFSTQENQPVLQLAASVERHYSHPLATAICKHADEQGIQALPCSSMQLLAGLGVMANIAIEHQDCPILIGSQRLMQQQGINISDEYLRLCEDAEKSMAAAVFVAKEQQVIGLLILEDSLRQGAKELVHFLAQQHIGMTILTGDSIAAAQHFERSLSQDSAHSIEVIAEVLPEDKSLQIQALQDKGKRVLMIGDGINDAPALAQADIAIAMGTGTDVSMECSDIVLMGGELQKIPWALMLGKRALKSIRQNLMFSLAYNIILVPAAMAAWLTPIFAAIAMPISSLVVIGNAILIRYHMRK